MNRFRCHYFVMADGVDAVQAELVAMRALKDAAEAKVVILEAEKLTLAEKPKRLQYPDVPVWDGKEPLGPFLESCDEFLEGYEDGEKLKYLVSRCTGSPQEHLRNQRDFNRKAGKGYTYKDGHESLISLYFTADPKEESRRLIVQKGVFQGRRTVKEYVHEILPHLTRIDSTDEDKRSYLMQGVGDQSFRQVCMTTYGHKGAEATVASLAKHILALDALADSVRGTGGQSEGSMAVQGKAKGKGVDLGAKGGIQKPKSKAKPAHASALGFKERQQLIKDNKCFVCREVGHNQNDAKRCTRHPDHAKVIGKGVAAMQVDQQKN